MTDNTTESSRRDVPAAAEPVSTQRKSMSDDVVDKLRAELRKVTEESIERKMEIRRLESAAKEMESKLEAATKERDEAAKEAESIAKKYSESEIAKKIQELEDGIASRDYELKLVDLHAAFMGAEGVEYQEGVSLDDLLQAAKINPAEIEEITPEFVTKAIETARASKPFLFVSQPAQAEPQTPGDVRQGAASPPSLKAFGAQAAGGGSAPPAPTEDPAKAFDWSDHAAVDRFFAERNAKNP